MSIITISSIVLSYSSNNNIMITKDLAKEIVNKLYNILTGMNYCHCIVPIKQNNSYVETNRYTIEWKDDNIQYRYEFQKEIIDCIYDYTFTKKTKEYYIVSTVYEINIHW